MNAQLIAPEGPLNVGNRPGWKTIHVVVDIQKISIGKEIFEFESEHDFSLSTDEPTRDIYFHSDTHGEDELVFFGLELKDNHIHLLPGNSNVDSVWIGPEMSTATAQPVQRKQRA